MVSGLLVIGCWLSVTVAYVAAVLPPREALHLGGSDKVDHVAAFLTISVLARRAYPRAGGGLLLALLAAFGGFIELSQALPLIGRDAQWSDWAADIAASVAGLAAAWPLARWRGRPGRV